MNPQFVDLSATPTLFFDFLPEDWSAEIAPVWTEYASTTRIFGVQESGQLIGGGIVFSTVSPDTKGYKSEAQSWFDKGYLYIAFLYVSIEHRGTGVGRFWVKELRKMIPKQPFWLAIEDRGLAKFYEPLGFDVKKEILNGETTEWILADQ